MSVIFDAGALIALERGDRAMWRRYKAARVSGQSMLSHGGVVGQVWRASGSRQARLSVALGGVDVRPLDDAAGKAAGALLSRARAADVIDAAVVLLAKDDDLVFTSDVDALEPLIAATGRHIELIAI